MTNPVENCPKYTAEQVEAMAADLRDAPGTSMLGTHISVSTSKAVAMYEVLTAYAATLRAALVQNAHGVVAGWQRNCPDYPNCPNLGCPCEPKNRPVNAELVAESTHAQLIVGPSRHSHIRLQSVAYHAARGAFGTETEADDRRVYQCVQAYLHAERARVPDGWRIQVDGDRVHVTKPDGAVTEWHKRPATNGSGMYDLCRALAAAPSQPEDAGKES